MSEKYVFRKGARVSGVSPQDVGEALEDIRQREGSLKASAVVQAAQPKEAPLHPAFTWDNEKAAGQWRLHEARHLIRSVQIVHEDQEPSTKYVHIRNEDTPEGAYQDVETVVRSPDLFATALRSLMVQMRSAEKAVHDLERAARQTEDPDRMARVGLAVRAVETAADAVRALH